MGKDIRLYLIVAIKGPAVASMDDLHRFLSESPLERPVTLTVKQL